MEDPSGKPGEASRDPPASGLVAFTIDAGSGRIVKLEVVDGRGARREPTREERTILLKKAGGPTLEDILEQTFEAGIASVLGDDAEADDEEEDEAHDTKEDAALRRLILAPMIERSAARRLMQREVLGKAVLATLIQDLEPEPTPEPGRSPPARDRSAASSTPRRSPRGRAQH